MVIFKKIKYKNFLSTGNVFTTINLNKNKNTLFVGKNGSGKSTILDALTFSLFGKPFRKINKPQLLNSITNSNLVVEIEFTVSNNEYKVIRGIKPTVFEIYKNGTLLNQSSESKDYQEFLEKQILKINYKSFCQVVVLGSATFLPFMQLSTMQRREIIENLLDLEIFTSMNTLLKEKISTNKELLTTTETQKKLLEQKINSSKEFIDNVKFKLENNEIKYKNIIKDIDEHSENLKLKLEDTKNNIHMLSEKISKEKDYYDKKTQLQTLKNKIQTNIDMIQEQIDFFEKNDNCPTCKQKIEDIFKTTTVKEKYEKLKELKEGFVKLNVSYDKANKKLETIYNIKNELNFYKVEEGKLVTEIKSLVDKKSTMMGSLKENDDSLITKEMEKINDYENQLKTVIVEYNDQLKEKELYNITSLLLKDSGIKSKIIKKYIPIINKTINKFLSDLNFFVVFELDEEFNEKIKSRNRDEFSYSSFSEGEKMKIDLAILFTWRHIAKLRNSIHTNLLIMDEVFDSSLDSDAVDDFMKIISTIDEKSNIFIISHKSDQLTDKFDKVFKFNKVKNFSKVS